MVSWCVPTPIYPFLPPPRAPRRGGTWADTKLIPATFLRSSNNCNSQAYNARWVHFFYKLLTLEAPASWSVPMTHCQACMLCFAVVSYVVYWSTLCFFPSNRICICHTGHASAHCAARSIMYGNAQATYNGAGRRNSCAFILYGLSANPNDCSDCYWCLNTNRFVCSASLLKHTIVIGCSNDSS